MESQTQIQESVSKPTCVVIGPVQARAGYGNMARDITTMLINTGRYNVSILPLPWGNCPLDALDEKNPTHKAIIDRLIVNTNQLPQPDISIVVSIPSEFKRIGKYSIGYTAGIETNAMSPEWVQACNQMDLILTISEHAKLVTLSTGYEARDKNTNQVVGNVKVEKPVEIVHPVLYTDIIRKISDNEILTSVRHTMKLVDEKFNFLFVGHWLNGDMGEDRKNVGLLIKLFLETFKDRKNKPGLILKTSSATFSILDREAIITKIKQIKASINSKDLPNIYLLHGDLTDDEMNSLYNHPKVKVHISLAHGEGFGIPLLEASISQKPVIASNWSGQLDFLNKDEALLVNGELKPIHQSAVWDKVLNAGTLWFAPDMQHACNLMNASFVNYDKYKQGALKLGVKNRERFNIKKIQKGFEELLDKYIPKFAVQVPLKLPTLRKL